MSFISKWKSFANKLGRINSFIILSLFYLTFCAIFSLVRLGDPLRKKLSKDKDTYWEDFEQKDFELEHYYRLS